MPTIEDERLVTAVAEHMRSHGLFTISTPQFDMIAHQLGYINGPRFVGYLKTPEGRAFFEKMWFKKRVPVREEKLSVEEKRKIVAEFKEIMGREPTVAETYELYAEEVRLLRR